jgi:hypothetical protein
VRGCQFGLESELSAEIDALVPEALELILGWKAKKEHTSMKTKETVTWN